MSDDDNRTLAEKARKLLRSGKLPGRRPDRVWAGASSGRDECPVCAEMVAAQQVVIEADFNGAEGLSTFSFHARCFWAFDSEWRRVEPACDSSDQPGPGLAAGAEGQSRLRQRSG